MKKLKIILKNGYYGLLKNFNHSKDNNIYLIYTMGKVGSSTIYRALSRKKPYSDIFHVHFLSDNWLNNILPTTPKNFHHNIKIGYDIRSFIHNNSQKRIKIITLVREPITRAISDLFENWQHIYEDIENVEKKELRKHIENVDHTYTLNWFDTEFYDYLKIDIYQLPFDKNKGYEIYNFVNCDILCLKLEMLNNIGTQAIEEFIGTKINLLPVNKSTNKKGNQHYDFLKNSVKIPQAKLLKLYQSKYVNHFYTENEVNNFIEQWVT